MSLEDKGKQHDGQVVDKFAAPLISYQMTTRDYVVRPDATAASLVVTLPPVAEAKGRFYSIVAQYASLTKTITIVDKDDSEGWSADIVLFSKGQGQTLYSDGMRWCLRTFASLDVSSRARFDGAIKHHYHTNSEQYAYQLRTECNLATTQFFGMDCEVHQLIDRTADGVEGMSMTARLTAAKTMSGTSSMIPIRGNLDVDGIVDGSGLWAAGWFVVEDGGTFTALSHLASLWVDSHQTGVIGGEHELIYMTNNGSTVLDQAFYIYGAMTALFNFNTISGGMMGSKVDADIAYAHYRKMACILDGVAGWILLGLDA